MINSKQDLEYYCLEDLKRFGNKKPSIKDWILHNEVWYIYHYIRHLLYVEFYKNTSASRVLFLWHFFRYKRLGFKLNFTIYPNTIGPGFRIYHTGSFVHVGSNVTIGNHCTILPGVVFGNKYEEANKSQVIVGDNCYIGLDAKILGSVKIGRNVTIGANAVVIRNIPDNAIVGGIPARIIRFKDF